MEIKITDTKNGRRTEENGQDKINLELSRTYFGTDADRRKNLDRRSDADRRDQNGRRKDEMSSAKKSADIKIFILASAVILLLSALYFSFSGRKDKTADIPSTENTVTSGIAGDTKPGESKPLSMVPPITSSGGIAALFDFEGSEEGWDIPAWALNLRDHVAVSIESSGKYASSGDYSLRVKTDFPGKQWSAALVEIQQFLNLDNFDAIAADVYFPPNKTKTLRAKIILTVGNSWEFVEMSRTFRIEPDTWTTVYANISGNSIDWKMKKLDNDFKKDIRKIAIRVESTKTPYSGYVYIDNIRALSQEEFEKVRN